MAIVGPWQPSEWASIQRVHEYILSLYIDILTDLYVQTKKLRQFANLWLLKRHCLLSVLLVT